MNDKLDIKNEIYRKLIHIFSTVIPVLYYFTSKDFILYLVGIGTVLMIAMDILKAYTATFEKLYKMFFHVILREDEKDFKRNLFTGGTYYAIGIFLALLFFQKEVAILSILIMIWCDTLAALVGKTLGKRKIVGNKTLEGSIAFTITGFILVLILQYVFPDFNYYKAGFITVLLAAVFEQLSLFKINDNLSLPLFSGLVFIIINNII
ncbi:MAG: diacylglycerol/polyprenol kinase family protein [Candidatus Kapaibacterium sp.]